MSFAHVLSVCQDLAKQYLISGAPFDFSKSEHLPKSLAITKGGNGSYKRTNKAGKSWSLFVTNKKDTLPVGEDCSYYLNGPWDEIYQFEGIGELLPKDESEEDNNPVIPNLGKNIKVGTYENHQYDNGGKNDWHYVTISREDDGNFKWMNKAGVSWSLYVTNKEDTLTVDEDCPYYANGYIEAVFNAEGIFGPGNEFYRFEDTREFLPKDESEEYPVVLNLGKNIKVGTYENHDYDNGGKNDWHYVTISRKDDGGYKWMNKAGVSWSLYVTNKEDTLTVGEDCPYYANRYTEAAFNAEGVFGPWNEFYQFESN